MRYDLFVDYRSHPAYGKEFRRISLPKRFGVTYSFAKAFRTILSKEIKYRIRRTINRCYKPPAETKKLSDTLAELGAITFSIETSEISGLEKVLAPVLSQLRIEKKDLVQGNYIGSAAYLNKENYPGAWCLLQQIVGKYKLLECTQAYLNVPVKVSHILLQVHNEQDSWVEDLYFEHLNLKKTLLAGFHQDLPVRSVKCILYLNEVTQVNGPLGYVLRSHHQRKFFDGLIRKANSFAHLDGKDKATREKFSALPNCLKRKLDAGNDLLPDSSVSESVLQNEKCFLSSEGNAILFDADGLHRRNRVLNGERISIQIAMVPHFNFSQ